MGKGLHDWRWRLRRMKGHLRHGAGTGGTGGDEIEVGAASQQHPCVQTVPVGASLSRGPGTWKFKMYFFKSELCIMFVSRSKEKKTI